MSKRLRPDDLRLGLKAAKKRTKRARTERMVEDALSLPARRRLSMAKAAGFGFPQEVKFFDTAVSFTADSTLEVPATGQWALIPQGDTQSTRDGRLARLKSIQFRGIITGPTTASSTNLDFVFYMWVILDRQANGAAAAVTDVFTNTLGASALINLNNSKRFRILHKEVIAPNTAGWTMNNTSAANVLAWPVEFFLPVNILMDWDSTTGAITEIKSNNVFIIAGVSGAGAIDDEYSVAGNARVRFVG